MVARRIAKAVSSGVFRRCEGFPIPHAPGIWEQDVSRVGRRSMNRDPYCVSAAGMRCLVITGLILLGIAPTICGQESMPGTPSPQWPGSTATRNPFQDVDISWRKLPRRVLNDQKDILLFPAQLAEGHHWVPLLATIGATAGLITADPHVMPYFRSHAGRLDDINDAFDGSITLAEIVLVPASVLAGGYLRHDAYAVKTGLLASEAYVDAAILDFGIKAVTRRRRPSAVPAGAPFDDTFFESGKSPFKSSSFPSGHAMAAFSVATVIAHRYRQHRWVPLAAYGFATVVGCSRVTTSAHFSSDVFVGAALGYTIAGFGVLRR